MPRYDFLKFLPDDIGCRMPTFSGGSFITAILILIVLTVFVLRSRQHPSTLLSFILVGWILALAQLIPPATVYKLNHEAVQVIYRIWDLTVPFTLILLSLSIAAVVESHIRHLSRTAILISWSTVIVSLLWWAMFIGVQYIPFPD